MQIVGWVKVISPQKLEFASTVGGINHGHCDSFPNSMGFQRNLFFEHDAVE